MGDKLVNEKFSILGQLLKNYKFLGSVRTSFVVKNLGNDRSKCALGVIPASPATDDEDRFLESRFISEKNGALKFCDNYY